MSSAHIIRQIPHLSEFFLPQFHNPEHAGKFIGMILQYRNQMEKPSLQNQHPVKPEALSKFLASLKRNPTGGIPLRFQRFRSSAISRARASGSR